MRIHWSARNWILVFFRQSTPEFQRDFLQKLAGEYGNATDYLLASCQTHAINI